METVLSGIDVSLFIREHEWVLDMQREFKAKEGDEARNNWHVLLKTKVGIFIFSWERGEEEREWEKEGGWGGNYKACKVVKGLARSWVSNT